MIRKLRNSEIDRVLYDACLMRASNATLYALSWYLDVVTDDWDCIVLGNYEVIMPIPYVKLKRNLFQKKILQPNFCQQLGLFSQEEISDEVFSEFYKIFRGLKPHSYSFNHINGLMHAELIELDAKDNFELNLNGSYEEIAQSYSNNLKRNLKDAKKHYLTISQDATVDDLIALKVEIAQVNMNKTMTARMKKLLESLLENNMGQVLAVMDSENSTLAIAFLAKFKNKMIHLFSASNDAGKKMKAMPFLLDSLIENNAEKEMVFDFEGSMIPGVARFFKSFGSKSSPYKSFAK